MNGITSEVKKEVITASELAVLFSKIESYIIKELLVVTKIQPLYV